MASAEIPRFPVSDEDLWLYHNSPEVRRAVDTVLDMVECEHSREARQLGLIAFFASYDRLRTDQVESLKAELLEAMRWSARPPVKVGQ